MTCTIYILTPMAAVKDDEFHNPYGDGNLPDPNDFMQNGDN